MWQWSMRYKRRGNDVAMQGTSMDWTRPVHDARIRWVRYGERRLVDVTVKMIDHAAKTAANDMSSEVRRLLREAARERSIYNTETV